MNDGLMQANTCGQATQPVAITITQQLASERAELQARLIEIDAATAAIEASPQVQTALDAISKLGQLRRW